MEKQGLKNSRARTDPKVVLALVRERIAVLSLTRCKPLGGGFYILKNTDSQKLPQVETTTRLTFRTRNWSLVEFVGGELVRDGYAVSYSQVFADGDGTLYEVFVTVKPKSASEVMA